MHGVGCEQPHLAALILGLLRGCTLPLVVELVGFNSVFLVLELA
jgi:hypothetical protein